PTQSHKFPPQGMTARTATIQNHRMTTKCRFMYARRDVISRIKIVLRRDGRLDSARKYHASSRSLLVEVQVDRRDYSCHVRSPIVKSSPLWLVVQLL
ncbi:hypothetical protein TNIN_380761, partial [Trichonephila inaurata madagascariensis]